MLSDPKFDLAWIFRAGGVLYSLYKLNFNAIFYINMYWRRIVDNKHKQFDKFNVSWFLGEKYRFSFIHE